MDAVRSAIDEILKNKRNEQFLNCILDNKTLAQSIIEPLVLEFRDGVKDHSKRFDFLYVLNLGYLAAIVGIDNAFAYFVIPLECQYESVFDDDKRFYDNYIAYAGMLARLVPERTDYNDEPDEIKILINLFFSKDTISWGKLVAFYALDAFLKSQSYKYQDNWSVSGDNIEEGLYRFYKKVLSLFTKEFDEDQTHVFYPILVQIIENILSGQLGLAKLLTVAYDAIENLIIISNFGFHYSGFKCYYRWLKQLEPNRYNNVMEAESFIRHWKNLDREKIFSLSTLSEIGSFLFGRIKDECNVNSGSIKVALKRINCYPFNDRPAPSTDEEYNLELCGYLGIDEPPKENYDKARELCRKIQTRYKETEHKIENLILQTKNLQQESKNRMECIVKASLNNRVTYNVSSDKDKLIVEFFNLKNLETLWKEETVKNSKEEYVLRESGILVYLKEILKENMRIFLDKKRNEESEIFGARLVEILRKWALEYSDKKKRNIFDFEEGKIEDKFSAYFRNLDTFDELLSCTPMELVQLVSCRIKTIPFLDDMKNESLHPYVCNANQYLHFLESVVHEAVNRISNVISKSAFEARCEVLKGALEAFRNAEYKIVINLLPVQIEGLFADFIELTSFYKFQNNLQKYVSNFEQQLVPKVHILNSTLGFNYVAYFKYFFNGIMRNTIAHGNYSLYIRSRMSSLSISEDMAIKILADELLLDLNALLYIMEDNTEIDIAKKYIEFTADSILVQSESNMLNAHGNASYNTEMEENNGTAGQVFIEETSPKEIVGGLNIKYERLFLDLIGRDRFNLNYPKGNIFITYEQKQILYWIFNDELAGYFDVRKLDIVRNTLCASEFWEYVNARLQQGIEFYNSDNVKVFRGIVTIMIGIVKEHQQELDDTLLRLKVVNNTLKEMQEN